MLDILSIIHYLADSVTASRIRCVCKKLSKLGVKPTKYICRDLIGDRIEYRVGTKFHREDGPAVESYYVKKWYLCGKLHREDGPAIECRSGGKEWYVHGLRHREDGPAIERSNGDKYWYLHGYFRKLDMRQR